MLGILPQLSNRDLDNAFCGTMYKPLVSKVSGGLLCFGDFGDDGCDGTCLRGDGLELDAFADGRLFPLLAPWLFARRKDCPDQPSAEAFVELLALAMLAFLKATDDAELVLQPRLRGVQGRLAPENDIVDTSASREHLY